VHLGSYFANFLYARRISHNVWWMAELRPFVLPVLIAHRSSGGHVGLAHNGGRAPRQRLVRPTQ